MLRNVTPKDNGGILKYKYPVLGYCSFITFSSHYQILIEALSLQIMFSLLMYFSISFLWYISRSVSGLLIESMLIFLSFLFLVVNGFTDAPFWYSTY